MDGLLMIAMNKHREICSIQSSGGIMLLKEQASQRAVTHSRPTDSLQAMTHSRQRDSLQAMTHSRPTDSLKTH